jgi:alpha-tubulin suppressor-like RCC1 family protein
LLFAYLVPDVQEATVFHYSLEKKVENSNRLYEIKAEMCEIIAHPTLTTIKTARSIKGISIGRHHSLCWDAEGQLFSWGCRSLGLGYGSLPSDVFSLSFRIECNNRDQ